MLNTAAVAPKTTGNPALLFTIVEDAAATEEVEIVKADEDEEDDEGSE